MSSKKTTSVNDHEDSFKLEGLHSQLNAHFIFNSLSLINKYVVCEENEKASAYITKFAKLLRLALENSHKLKVTLKKEIELITNYLDLESARLDHSFCYEILVEDDVDVKMLIPSMIIQPMIENAIWHRLRNVSKGGILKIRFSFSSDFIHCEIFDNGEVENENTQYRLDIYESVRDGSAFDPHKRLDYINAVYHEQSFITKEVTTEKIEFSTCERISFQTIKTDFS